eukprot:8449081-Pyramimonas_sp.AAC.1
MTGPCAGERRTAGTGAVPTGLRLGCIPIGMALANPAVVWTFTSTLLGGVFRGVSSPAGGVFRGPAACIPALRHNWKLGVEIYLPGQSVEGAVGLAVELDEHVVPDLDDHGVVVVHQ